MYRQINEQNLATMCGNEFNLMTLKHENLQNKQKIANRI